MIKMKSSGDYEWPWSKSGWRAEAVFQETYPSLYDHFKTHEIKLRNRSDQGVFWWELRSCAYWEKFKAPKIAYQDIAWEPRFSVDLNGNVCNDTIFFVSTGDLWILAALNSPVSWWLAWRTVYHGKDEALRLKTVFMQDFPIPEPSDSQSELCKCLVTRIIDLTSIRESTIRDILDWLKVEHEIAEPSTKLQNPIALDSDSLIAEVKKIRGKKKPLSLAALRSLRDEHARTILPAQALAIEARGLERQVSDLVNQAYGLTPDEVRLMWQTAPPRMPIAPPSAIAD